MTASTVSPLPRAGNSALVVVMISTQYEVLPAHADAQNPPRRIEADVVAETGLGVGEDAGIQIGLAGGEPLKDERQHEHSRARDGPGDDCAEHTGFHAEAPRQQEHARPDHRSHDHRGQRREADLLLGLFGGRFGTSHSANPASSVGGTFKTLSER